MRVKLYCGNSVLGYVKIDIASEVEIPAVIAFHGRNYKVTHRDTIIPNLLLKVIVEPIGIIEEIRRPAGLIRKVFKGVKDGWKQIRFFRT